MAMSPSSNRTCGSGCRAVASEYLIEADIASARNMRSGKLCTAIWSIEPVAHIEHDGRLRPVEFSRERLRTHQQTLAGGHRCSNSSVSTVVSSAKARARCECSFLISGFSSAAVMAKPAGRNTGS